MSVHLFTCILSRNTFAPDWLPPKPRPTDPTDGPPPSGFGREAPHPHAGLFPFSGPGAKSAAAHRRSLTNVTVAAAFFDLDRTLLSGASGQVVSRVLRDAGVVHRDVPGEALAYKIFQVVGESLPLMWLGRQTAVAMKGHSQAEVLRAAHASVGELQSLMQPYARSVMEMHRTAGRKVVLATTTPRDLISAFAEAEGFDDVIATTWAVDGDGWYTGELDGPYVWSRGKRDAVRAWCVDNDVDLSESWAYSDSVYDEPLLSSVGHPHAVNPDVRLHLMAAARRWPVVHFDVPEGVAKIPVVGLELQKVAMTFCRPEMFPYARFHIEGVENIPRNGGALICGNHRSYFDVAAVAMAIARAGRTARFLGKKEVFDAPVIGPLATAMGGIRVDRGTGSDEPVKAAEQALIAGDVVAVMPQGTIPRGRAFYDPVLKGRWGAARLAHASRVPVIPVGIWGTENVWPRNAKLPNIMNLASPPLITIVVGAPVELRYDSVGADTERIMAAITDLLPPEARERREPTAEDIRRALPSGYSGDLDAESTRRPGTDA